MSLTPNEGDLAAGQRVLYLNGPIRFKQQAFTSPPLSCRMVMYRRASQTSLPLPKVFSLSEDMALLNKQQVVSMPCQRIGIMAAFISFQQFEK